MLRNDDSATKNILDYLYYQTYYKVIRIGLPRQKIQVILDKLISQDN